MAYRTSLTISETAFEAWCSRRGLEVVRIRESQTNGQKRPDYALRLDPRWCIVEIKELDVMPDDVSLLQKAQAGTAFGWIDPGARLRRPLRAASDQLRKLSRLGFPTVVCFFDTTASFHLERPHVLQAMFGRETIRVAVPDSAHPDPVYLGMKYGAGATLTRKGNTSVSAVAAMRQPAGSDLVIDLYHNPHARVPIPPAAAAPFVRKQYGEGLPDPDRAEPTVLDSVQTDEWQEWLADREGKCEREIEACLREIRSARAP